MSKKFTKQQREILARKLGYEGPMNMFDQFVKSDPAMERKYNTVTEKYMARGGMVKKYAEGGQVTQEEAQQQQPQQAQTDFVSVVNRTLDKKYTPLLSSVDNEIQKNVNEYNTQLKQKQDAYKNYLATERQKYIASFLNKEGYTAGVRDLLSQAERAKNAKIGDVLKDGLLKIEISSPEDVDYFKNTVAKKLEDRVQQKLAQGNSAALKSLESGDWEAGLNERYYTEVLQPLEQQYAAMNEQAYNKRLNTQYQRDTEFERLLPRVQNYYDDYIATNTKYLEGIQKQLDDSNNTYLQAIKQRPAEYNELTQNYNQTKANLLAQSNVVKQALNDKVNAFFDPNFTFNGTKEDIDRLDNVFNTSLKQYATEANIEVPQINLGVVAPAAGSTPQTPASTQTQAALSQPTTTPTTTPTTGTAPSTPTTTPTTGTTGTTTATTTTPVTGTTAPTTGTTTPTAGTTTPGVTTGVTATSTPGIQTTGTTTTPSTGGMTGTQMATIPTTNTVPRVNIPQVTAATIPTEPGQEVSTTGAPTQAAQIPGATVAGVAQVTPTAPQAAATMEASTATGAVSGELAGLQPAQGAVSEQAQVKPETMEPTSTALAGLQAAQGVAGQVTGAPTRELVAGELIEGPTVDRAAVEAALAKNEAAQGVVTEDMTVQGQLAKLTTNFEANNPPAWAAGALRNATAVMAQRGLAASSLAGQALIQATIESALPIASADAQIYREMGIQNLTNKQQMAVLSAQQRAAFLGQEFDQAFQTRATNAATISEIANLNFSAKQQVALENARLTESVNLANLNNRQALVMANAAQIATLETANLNNRQQANVLNAQAFLQMDLTNLSNRQQTALFKSQSMIQSILSDQAAENAARQFNAASVNQVNQFYDGLTAQIKQFNATQANAMNQFNVSQINSVAEFNASQQNARDQFNADYRRVIDQSNAEWRRNIALADTAAINRANEVNATAALGITTIEYNNLWQTYRDQIEYAWKTGENALDRENELARQVLAKQATIEAAKFQIEAAKYQALGNLAAQVFDKGGIAAGIGSFLSGSGAGGFLTGAATGIRNLFNMGGSSGSVNWNELTNADQNNPNGAAYGWSYYSNGTDTIAIDPNGSVYYNGNTVVDDQLAYLEGYIGPPAIEGSQYDYGEAPDMSIQEDNYIFPTD